MRNFGKRVREARLRYGWTQKKLAMASGLAQSAIGNYESGLRTVPSAAALMKLAYALHVSASWLTDGEGPMEDPHLIGTASSTSALSSTAKASPSGLEWPFQSVSFSRFSELSEADKRLLEALVATFVQSRGSQQ